MAPKELDRFSSEAFDLPRPTVRLVESPPFSFSVPVLPHMNPREKECRLRTLGHTEFLPALLSTLPREPLCASVVAILVYVYPSLDLVALTPQFAVNQFVFESLHQLVSHASKTRVLEKVPIQWKTNGAPSLCLSLWCALLSALLSRSS